MHLGGASFLGEEHLAIAYHAEFGLPTTVVRPFNVYGPGQVGEGAIRNFMIAALGGAPITIHGDGAQIRAWCYVDDMIDCVLRALERPEAVGETFNVGHPASASSIYALAEAIVRVTGFCPSAQANGFRKSSICVGLSPTSYWNWLCSRTSWALPVGSGVL